LQSKTLTVSAPSRLHFGLLSIGDATERKYGGAGLMIDSPRSVVTVSSSDAFEIIASDNSRNAIVASVDNWHKHLASAQLRELAAVELPVRLEVESVARHSGLGSGTQLSFAVATALQLAFSLPIPSTEDLALSQGRGKRSAIGSYGFHQGGFLVDRGIVNESIAPLDMRIDFPASWKVVLIEPRVEQGSLVSGAAELDAFKSLPATPQEEADHLAALLGSHIVPSILSQNFSDFAKSVSDYGYRSGLFYSPVQGGAYASPIAGEIVDRISAFGEYAIGQSSWGPLLFAIAKSEKESQLLVDYLGEHCEDVACHVSVASADNRGMMVQHNSSQTR